MRRETRSADGVRGYPPPIPGCSMGVYCRTRREPLRWAEAPRQDVEERKPSPLRRKKLAGVDVDHLPKPSPINPENASND